MHVFNEDIKCDIKFTFPLTCLSPDYRWTQKTISLLCKAITYKNKSYIKNANNIIILYIIRENNNII